MRFNLLLLLLLILTACTKQKSALETYVEQTNKQCPMPISPYSKSQFMGITLTDTSALFSYSLHDDEVDWTTPVEQQSQTLRHDIANMLQSDEPEMQELLALLRASSIAAQFSYESITDPERKILITFTPEQLTHLDQVDNPSEEDENNFLTSFVDSLRHQTPILLSEGTTLQNIELQTASAPQLNLCIQLQEEPFMALRVSANRELSTQLPELLDALKKTSLLPLIEYCNSNEVRIRTVYKGITSQDSVEITF